jgi:hypothetical protein
MVGHASRRPAECRRAAFPAARYHGRWLRSAGRRAESPTVGNQVTFGARSTSIRGARADLGTPFLAAMEQLSMQARFQSMRPVCRRRRSNSRCRPSHTPACCQSRSRRQQVTPEPHPISCGSISHEMPVSAMPKAGWCGGGFPVTVWGRCHAVQSQCRASSSYPDAATSGHELGSL